MSNTREIEDMDVEEEGWMEKEIEKEKWMSEIDAEIERSLWKWDLTMDPDAPEWIPMDPKAPEFFPWSLPPKNPIRPNRNILINQLTRRSTRKERTAFYV